MIGAWGRRDRTSYLNVNDVATFVRTLEWAGHAIFETEKYAELRRSGNDSYRFCDARFAERRDS